MLVAVSSIFLWVLVSNFTATASVTIDDITVHKTIEKNKYEQVIQDYLISNPMSRFTFLLNQTALRDYVANRLPEVSVVVQRGMVGFGRTSFVITMRNPVACWQINDKQYFVDSNGIAFEKNYYLTPSVKIVDNSGVSIKSDATAIASRRFLSFVGRIVYLTKSSGYFVTKAILPSGTTRELEVHLKGVNTYVKLNIDRSAGEQVEDMIKAITYLKDHNQTPQYIDVRVSGKAFYYS